MYIYYIVIIYTMVNAYENAVVVTFLGKLV